MNYLNVLQKTVVFQELRIFDKNIILKKKSFTHHQILASIVWKEESEVWKKKY